MTSALATLVAMFLAGVMARPSCNLGLIIRSESQVCVQRTDKRICLIDSNSPRQTDIVLSIDIGWHLDFEGEIPLAGLGIEDSSSGF